MMKLYGGIDLHSNNCVVHLIDEDGQPVFKRRIPNDLFTILLQLGPYSRDIEGLVVESTFNWYWLVDGLRETGYKVHLANTTAIQQYSGLKHSDDDSDANWLATLLRLDILPEGYVYPKEERSAGFVTKTPSASATKHAAPTLYSRALSTTSQYQVK